MRQRSLTQRIFTALFGIWFSLLVAEPIPLHACPMHDGPVAQAAVHSMTTAVAASAVVDEQLAARHASSAHAQRATEHETGHGSHPCQCLGCCAGASAISLPTIPDDNLQATIAATQARRSTPHDTLRRTPRFAYALPFANGPPARVQLVN